MLNESQRRRYARQVILSELGPAGQARLCASAVAIAPGADPLAAEVASDYLRRAGLQLEAAASERECAVASSDAVLDCAGEPALAGCAAWLLGAWAAVETIKHSAGVGTQTLSPGELVLSGSVLHESVLHTEDL